MTLVFFLFITAGQDCSLYHAGAGEDVWRC